MDELIKNLREMGNSENCVIASAENFNAMQIIKQAANTIEELLTLKELADAKIERLENAKSKKKRPPKRLPCTCGRKKLELWWSKDGWFLKCPNCGRESQPERYQSHVNSVWNNGLPRPPMEG